MLFRPQGTQAIAYAVNALNQYTSVTTDGAPATITHDPNGNLTGDGSNTFTYDAENRLLSAAMGGGANVAYAYGPMGRRAAKTVDGVTTEYLYDGDHAIAELDGLGAVLRRYVHGPGTDRPIAMVEGGPGSYTHSYYHADRLGSVIAMTDDSGAPVAHYTYDGYGIPYLVDPGTGAQTQVAAGQPYLFTGRRFDFETGLYYYRARYYSASLGRFLQTDPVGYEDQMNLYAYVGNDPVNGTDPSGERRCPGIPNCLEADTYDPKKAGNQTSVADDIDLGYVDRNKSDFQIKDDAEAKRTNEKLSVVQRGDDPGDVSHRRLQKVKTTQDRKKTKAQGKLNSSKVPSYVKPTSAVHGHAIKGGTIAPGPDDDQPLKKGFPDIIVHGNRQGVVEIVNGRVRYRITRGRAKRGDWRSHELNEEKLIQDRIDEFQRRRQQ